MRCVREGKVGSLVVSPPERGSEGRGLVGGEKGRCLGSDIGGFSEEKLVAEAEVRELGVKDGVLGGFGFGDGEKVGSFVSDNVGLLVDKWDAEVEAKELEMGDCGAIGGLEGCGLVVDEKASSLISDNVGLLADKLDAEVEAKELEMEDGGAIRGLEGCDLVVNEKVSSLVSGDAVLLVGKSDAEVEVRELGTENSGAISLVLDEKVNTLISGSVGSLEDKSVVEVEARELGSGGGEATQEHQGCDDACGSVEVGTSGEGTLAADDRMSYLMTDDVAPLGSESCDADCKAVKEVDCLVSNDGSESVAVGTSRGCITAVLELVSPLPGDNVAPLDDKCAAGEKVEEIPVLCNSEDGEVVKEVDMLVSDVHASRIYDNGSVEQGSTSEGHGLTIVTVSPLPGDILASSDDKLSVEVTASESGIEFAKADKEIVEEKVECLLPNAAELAAESNNTDGEVAKEVSVGFSRLIDGSASIVLNPSRDVRLMVDETTVPSPNETVVSLSIKSSVDFRVREFTSDCNNEDGDTVTEFDCMVSDVGPSQLLDKSECVELFTSRDDSLAIENTVGPSQSENVALLNIENEKVVPVLESNGTDEGLENGNMKMSQEGDISSVLDEQDATVHCGHNDERDTVLDVREEFRASSCETGRVISLSVEKEFAPEPSLTNASVSSVQIRPLISDNSKATEVAARDSQGLAYLGSVAISGDQSTCNSKDIQEPNPVVFSRRSNPKRAASLRKASTVAETQQITRICRVERSKKAAGKSISSSRSLTWVFSNNITRKRGPRKLGNASAWGMVLNVSEMFCLSDMASNSNNEIDLSGVNSKIQKCSSGRQTTKAKKASRGKGVKSATSTKSLDLTEQITSQTLTAISDPLSASAVPDNLVLSHGNQISNICSGGQVSSSDGCLNTQLLHPDSYIDSSIPSTEKDCQHGEKDPESSITEETSFENNPGNFAGISSQVGSGLSVEIGDDKLLSYPGTSPESDIVHPTADVVNLMSDFITLAIPKSSVDVETTCENFCPDSSPKDNLHLGISSLANASTSSFSLKTEPLSLRREDRNIEVQETLSGLPELLLPGKGAKMLSQQSKIEKPTKLCESACRKQASSARKSHNRNSRRKPCKKGSNSLELLTGPPSPETMILTCSVGTVDAKTGELAPVSSEQDVQKTLSPEISKAEGSRQRAVAKKHNNGKHKKEKIINKKKAENTETLKRCAVEQEGQAQNACVTGNELLAHDSGIGNTPSPTSTIDSNGGTTINLDNGITPGNQLESGVAFHSDKSVLENPHLFSENQYLPPRIAWVCCDDCSKWRCIPAELADQINETNCKWNCKDNSDKAFADCSIPQEKTNAEINAELEISEGSCEEDSHVPQTKSISPDHAKLSANQQSSWKRIKSNLFLHRSRKTQTIDEIMVCHCKPPTDGSLGCRDECLNRMLNIECVRGTCPCGDLCSNQQFQKRKYAKLKWYRCGKKGYGLQLQENISEGHFLIEYVGEVLEMAAYEARQREYASRGQKHFYFMTLNNSEVIDACSKGNLGRFINHSCDPNCRTEKWMVNGEVCIGLFAFRDIKKGEEVTFDYNYVRVVGAAVKKCMCGAAACRGYIGGDPSNSEVIVQSDSDEEYTEPVMVRKDSGSQQFINKPVLDTVSITRVQAHSSLDTEKSLQERIGVTSISVKNDCQQNIDLANGSSVNPVPEISLETKNNNSTSACDVKILPSDASSEELNSTSISRPAAAIDDLIVTNDKDGNAVNTRKIAPKKLPRSSAQVEKNRTHVDQGRKCVAQKTKKIAAASCNGHFDEVKETLNALIGADGGISKSKDGATKGYLKLLVVTAADNAENSRSTRDLSLILDALLMTKSRTILTDIVTKNGLQMLHNIMKKNQKDNNKIPVLRKLLKVLLFLAEKKILDKQHLNMNPSCAGAESFHDSLIKLIQHKDVKVHDAARGFLNMLGCHATKPKFTERSNGSLNFRRKYQQSSSTKYDHHIVGSTDAVSHDPHTIHRRSMLTGTCSTSDGCKASENYPNISSSVQDELISELIPQKRRSRWDQDKPLKKIKLGQKSSSLTESRNLNTSQGCAVRRSYSQHHERNHSVESRLEVCSGAAVASNISEFHTVGEAPPGFGSLSGDANNNRSRHANVVTPAVGCDVALAKRQERYLSHLPISHGIPLVVMQQFGTPTCAEENRGDNFLQSWAVAPGTTFHAYPPLPSYPRKKAKCDVQSSYSQNHQTTTSNSMDRSHRTEQFTSGQSRSSTSMSGTQVGAIYVGKAGSSRQSLHGSGSGSSNPHPNIKNGGDVSWRPWPREK